MRHILFCCVLTTPCVAQGNTPWVQVASGGPSARFKHDMAFDVVRQRTVLFGGSYGGNTNLFGDTWEWDGSSWLPRSPAASPPARLGHAMTFDSARQRVVLFGGEGPLSLGDTWEWDGSNWLQLFPATSPPASVYHAMAYDSARQVAVLFGGAAGPLIFGGTWEWDGSSWTARSPLASPSARYLHAMAYDAARHRTILFGGYDNNSYFADTWEWDGSSWLAGVSVNYPSARSDGGLAYDSSRQRSVLFGGYGNGVQFADTWAWDGSTWVHWTPAVSPEVRDGHAMVHDSARQQIVLFGGHGGGGGWPILSDTWELGLPLAATATPYGIGCGAPALQMAPAAGSRPLIGQVQVSDITHAPLGIAFVAWGLSGSLAGPFALPLPLDWYGLPGCLLWQNCDREFAGLCASTSSTSAQFNLSIPNLMWIRGLHLYLQAWAPTPLGYNQAGMIVSNGLNLLLGDS